MVSGIENLTYDFHVGSLDLLHNSFKLSLLMNASVLKRSVLADSGTYRIRIASDNTDVALAQRLRFEIFNLELHEGLDSAYLTGLDVDPFDAACDHLLVEHLQTRQIVGTYRLQTGLTAEANLGYYSAQEFEFAPFECVRSEIVELGRACVHKDHRKLGVLNLLWRGITVYAVQRKARYLIGCSSLTSQDPALGWATYHRLASEHLAESRFQTRPLDAYTLPEADLMLDCPAPPRLLRAYLALGAKICGPPALDREFKTIDFLTLVDLSAMSQVAQKHFFS